MKRARLNRNPNSTKDKSRLRSTFKRDMHTYSDTMLKDFVTSPSSVRKTDPIMQMMHELAKDEQVRRHGLKKAWKEGEFAPVKKKGLDPFAPVKVTFAGLKYVFDLPYRVYSGKLEGDIERATDYVFENIDQLLHFKERADKRWHNWAVAHHLAHKTSTDFIKQGYDVVNRFAFDDSPSVLKMQFKRYKNKYPSLVIVPTQVRGKKYYDLMVKANT